MKPTIVHPDPGAECFIAEGCHILESWNREQDPDCSVARARVAPGDTTHWHRLRDIRERYLIISGSGRVEVGDLAPETVGPGDLVIIPPGTAQRITNIGSADLLFYAICTPRFVPGAYEDLETGPPAHAEDLEEDLFARLQAHPEGISEYALLQALRAEDHPVTAVAHSDHGDHRLFQEHFQLFHLLYRLRDRCHAEARARIEINPLCIRALPYQAAGSDLPGHTDPLRAYYLDPANLGGTSGADVDGMLGRFWVRMQGLEQRGEALQVLGLEVDADFEQARERYRRLAMEHHPDRGGDTRRLQEINAAMEVLARAYGRGKSS
jgi:mannose-6-phosphate isomerase-like protein (cupin superfamily)